MRALDVAAPLKLDPRTADLEDIAHNSEEGYATLLEEHPEQWIEEARVADAWVQEAEEDYTIDHVRSTPDLDHWMHDRIDLSKLRQYILREPDVYADCRLSLRQHNPID